MYFYTSVDIDIIYNNIVTLWCPFIFCLQEEVLSQLQAQRKFMSEAQAERNRMLQKIAQLEEMVELI